MIDRDEGDSGATAKAPETAITRDDRPVSKRAGASERPMQRRALGGRGVVLPISESSTVAKGAANAPRFESLRRLSVNASTDDLLVRDQDIDRNVAVKRVLSGAPDGVAPERPSPGALDRFARLIRTMGRLEHPSIVPVHDVAIDEEGTHYAVLKYVEGETLAAIISRLVARDPSTLARFTFPRRVQIFVEVLRAFQLAHERGIVHGGITPAGITIGLGLEATVTDWDVAVTGESRESTKKQGNRRLTTKSGEAFTSPEEAAEKELDARSDTYRLSVVFREFLTIPSRRSEVPPELVHFVRRGEREAPSERYQSVTEMIDALDRIRDGRVLVQCHRTFMKRLASEIAHGVDSHPFAVLAAFAVTIALVAVGIAALSVLAMR